MELSSHFVKVDSTHVLHSEFCYEKLPCNIFRWCSFGHRHPPQVCNAFVEAFSMFFRANFLPWKDHHLSFQENLWVDIFPFSQLLFAEGQLGMVTLLFAMLEIFAGGYQQYLMRLILAHVSMEHGMLAHHPH